MFYSFMYCFTCWIVVSSYMLESVVSIVIAQSCRCLSRFGLFFFFKQKTAYDRLMRDWSSDVCSSDLKCNGMRILSNSLKGEPGGMAKLIVKLQSCEVAHQISALAIDAMGEMGILYHRSPRERDGGAWQWNYMFQLGLIIGGGTAQIDRKSTRLHSSH